LKEVLLSPDILGVCLAAREQDYAKSFQATFMKLYGIIDISLWELSTH